MNKTIYVKVENEERFKLSNFPNAGPHANIKGMKNLYWGKNAFCVKCGAYVYKVDEYTYEQAKFCV